LGDFLIFFIIYLEICSRRIVKSKTHFHSHEMEING
jgi:hypothetical protein